MLKYIPLLLFSLIFLNSSCSRYYYSPDDGQLLAINQKGDFHFSNSANSLRLKDSSNHINLQLGYSPIKHLAVQGSFFYAKDQDQEDPLVTGKGHIWSGAIGGYHFLKPWSKSPLRKNKNRRRAEGVKFEPPVFFQKNYLKEGVSIELYLGYASGLSRLDYRSMGMSLTNFQKTFGQFGFHWFNELGGFSYTMKVGQLHFSKAQSTGLVDLRDLENLGRLENNNTFTIRESSFRLFTGIRQVSCFFNITLINGSSDLDLIGADEGNFSIGVLVDIDECFRKNKE